MYAELHKITQLLKQNREEAQNGLGAIGQKLNVSKDHIKAEVLTSATAPIPNHSVKAWGIWINLGLGEIPQRRLIIWGKRN